MAAQSGDRFRCLHTGRLIAIAEQMQADDLNVMIVGTGVRTAVDKGIAARRSILSRNFSEYDSRVKDEFCTAIQYDGAAEIVGANLIDVDSAAS